MTHEQSGRQVRRITGEEVDANSVELRLWIAATIIRGLEDVIDGPMREVRARLRMIGGKG